MSKGIAPLILVPLILIVLFGAAVVAVPGLGGSLAAIVTGPKLCSEAPYDSNCICPEGERQLKAPALAGLASQHFCEKLTTFIDPSASDFAARAAAYATSKLNEQFPGCDMAACNSHGASWRVGAGYFYPETGIIKGRVVGLDCMDNQLFTFAQVEFDVETGAIQEASCGSYSDVVHDTTSAEPASMALLPKSFASGGVNVNYPRVSYHFSFDSQCGSTDNGVGTLTVYAPDDAKMSYWTIFSMPSWIDCKILTTTPTFATIQCDSHCPHGGFGAEGEIRSAYDPTQCVVRKDLSTSIVQNGYYTCQIKGTDIVSSTGITHVTTTDYAFCDAGTVRIIISDVSACDDSILPATYTVNPAASCTGAESTCSSFACPAGQVKTATPTSNSYVFRYTCVSADSEPAPSPTPQQRPWPTWGDKCVARFAGSASSNTQMVPVGQLNYYAGGDSCYTNGAMNQRTGGCPAVPIPNLQTADYNTLVTALGCGKVTTTDFKSTCINRNLACLPTA